MSSRIGLIGLGNAGAAMLQALSVHFTVHVYDRNSERVAAVCPGCQRPPVVAQGAAELARAVDLVILSLPTPEASRRVTEEIRASVMGATTVVECSTVAPEDVEWCHDLLSSTGARFVDAPLVGGVQKLAQGEGVFLVGCAESDAGIVGKVLEPIAAEICFLGERGNGMRTKLIVNAVAHVVYVALMEAGALAAAQNVPLSVLQRLLMRESGLLRPLTYRFGERLRDRDFDGGMSTANARKDSALIVEMAHRLGVPLFATAAAHSVYELAVREGLGELDYASLGTLWERWLGVSLSTRSRHDV